MTQLDERAYEDCINGWLDAEDPAKALECCKEGIQYYPDNPELYRLAAIACSYLKQYQDAITHLTKKMSQLPNDAGAYEYRASINRDAGNYDASIEDYTSAIKIAPHPRLYFHRAYARHLHRDIDGTKDDLRFILSSHDAYYITMATQMLEEIEGK